MNRLRLVICVLSAVLAGCLAGAPKTQRVVLSYPYGEEEALRFDGYRELAERLSPSYVRVLILDQAARTSGGKNRGGQPIINGASGFIVDPRGYVITVAHIALDTRFTAEVTTVDGRVHEAAIIHVDPARELAVLKIQPFAGMQVAKLADSRQVQKGQYVLAIGTPDNRKGVVALGTVVDPKWPQRLEYIGYGYDDAIKMHIDVQPGHSGGPVFNRKGETIGIVASFALGDLSKTPYVSPKLAYAVPSNAIRAYLEQVIGD